MTGTWKNGHIVLDASPDWPDGCRLTIEPGIPQERFGIREEDWGASPEDIAQWLAWYRNLEPLELTSEEEEEIHAWRRQVKEYTTDKMKHAEGLFE